VAAADLAFTRTAGLSQRKAEYIQGLAQKFASGELSARMLVEASDEELLEKLTAVRGLGRWSVEMFACFALKRADIFSTGDLGVQRGVASYMGKDVSKLKNKGGKWKYMSEQDMVEVASKFAPYRLVHPQRLTIASNPVLGVYSCGTCGGSKTSMLRQWRTHEWTGFWEVSGRVLDETLDQARCKKLLECGSCQSNSPTLPGAFPGSFLASLRLAILVKEALGFRFRDDIMQYVSFNSSFNNTGS
jgi:hypothetical protein